MTVPVAPAPAGDGADSRAAAKVARATGSTRRRGAARWLVRATATLGLVPAAKMVADGIAGGLGANPIEQVQNRLGFWTLTFLTLGLAATPAHDLLGLRWPVRIRRALGLLAFGYGALHLAWYLGVDKFFDLGEVLQDVAKRRFITVGFSAFLLLVPLAVTSTDAWVRRLGYARWKRMHRLVYAAAGLAVVHFLWRVKADHRRPAAFAVVIGALMLVRIVPWARRARRGRQRAAPLPRGAQQ